MFNNINKQLEFFICFEIALNVAGIGVVCKTECSAIPSGTWHIDCIFIGAVSK